MEQHNAPSNAQSRDHADDEISLGELFGMLWQGKWLIVAVMAIAVCIASAYVSFTPNIYEARSEILPPSDSSVAAYDSAWQLITGSPTTTIVAAGADSSVDPVDITAKRFYKAVGQRLASEFLRRYFFESSCMAADPVHNSKVESSDQAELQDKQSQHVPSAISVTEDEGGKGGKIKMKRIVLTVQGTNPQQVADWANQYMQCAIRTVQQEWLNNLDSERQQRIQYLDRQIEAQRAVAQKQKINRIAMLRETMVLAQANELQTANNTSSLVSSYQSDSLYLRGSRVLKAELGELENRSNNDPFIPELPHLLEHKKLLENITLTANQIGVAQVDLPAITPVAPIKPKKALILVLSVMLGAMLGGTIAIGRGFYGKQK